MAWPRPGLAEGKAFWLAAGAGPKAWSRATADLRQEPPLRGQTDRPPTGWNPDRGPYLHGQDRRQADQAVRGDMPDGRRRDPGDPGRGGRPFVASVVLHRPPDERKGHRANGAGSLGNRVGLSRSEGDQEDCPAPAPPLPRERRRVELASVGPRPDRGLGVGIGQIKSQRSKRLSVGRPRPTSLPRRWP